MKEYIITKRARILTLSGNVNLPYGTILIENDGYIFHNGKVLFRSTSENAYQYTARNDDGNGKERGALINAIKAKLEKRDADYRLRWDKVWEDAVCQSYKRADHEDYWLWNHEFYNAPIDDLRYIAELVGAKVKE